jgi:redox-sensitive bicupin YhaK (pirin superfamily)
MSYQDASSPKCEKSGGAIELLITPAEKDLGEFTVRRVLPSPERRMVGPFIFFDHMGPAVFAPGEGIQVRPHPHIGLATITFLFEGEIMHRDSLGYVQPIEPGAVNLMTAGKGIVHSERSGADFETLAYLHGIQSWIALPEDQEERDPGFAHYPAGDLPRLDAGEVAVTVIMGEAFGAASPVKTFSPTLYLDCHMPKGSTLVLDDLYDERAVYVVSGEVCFGEQALTAGVMAVVCPDQPIRLYADVDSQVMVIGGAALGNRHIWWNFVSSSKARIEQAKADWREGRFDEVPGDSEYIPLPD